jgi:hypothetical protein
MSEKRILVLLAGGYSAEAVQKHLLSVDGLPLFERIIDAVPADTVWIVHSKWNQGWWAKWRLDNMDTTFKDKNLGIYVDAQKVNNPALWITSNVPVYLTHSVITEVVFSAIDSYFKNFNFMDELMEQEHAIVVAKGDMLGRPALTLDWKGKIKTPPYVCGTLNVHSEGWVFTDMMKTTVKQLSKYGQFQRGTMADVVSLMMLKGTDFKVVKAKCPYMDCGTPERLGKAKHLLGVETKGMVVI